MHEYQKEKLKNNINRQLEKAIQEAIFYFYEL